MKNSKLDFTKITDEQLLELNLDELNATQMAQYTQRVNQVKLTPSKTRSGMDLFNYPEGMDKKKMKGFRNKARKTINRLADQIIEAQSQKDKKVLGELVKEFKAFYKEVYKLNDFSLESIRRRNSDTATKLKLTAMLKAVKDFK